MCGGIEQVKATDNIDDPMVTTHLFGILNNIADASMGTAGNNDQSFARMVDEGRVINNLIIFFRPLFSAKSEVRFKIIPAGYFS